MPDPKDVSDEAPAVPLEESRIIIRPDGEVVIENLSESLAEVALSLDPEADLACELPGAGAAPAAEPEPKS